MVTKPHTLQVDDNPGLLEQMMNDLEKAPVLYQPTNYWKVYEKAFISELKTIGLKDFRRRKNSILSRFGATDLTEKRFYDLKNNENLINSFRKIPGGQKILVLLDSVINRVLYYIPFFSYFKKRSDFKYACSLGEKYNSGSLKKTEVSLAGNPMSVYHIDNRNYTPGFLYYYLRYVYCSRFINFNGIKIIAELGSGSGKQAEVIMKLHPELIYIIFDIPPQLYVCQQYLEKVFPGAVAGYETTQRITSFRDLKEGMIYIAAYWKFPLIADLDIDLFWNAASFQEMEPDVVSNYLGLVNKVSKYIYLQQNMAGKETASNQGERGVLQPVILEDYKKDLTGYELADILKCLMLKGHRLPPGYMDSLWIRKKD
jgi:putative sugar O-methyltransferase